MNNKRHIYEMALISSIIGTANAAAWNVVARVAEISAQLGTGGMAWTTALALAAGALVGICITAKNTRPKSEDAAPNEGAET